MPDPIPFRRRREDLVEPARPEHTIEHALALQADPSLNVRLSKEGRTRNYQIRPGRGQFEWYCQVWFDNVQHRGDRVRGTTDAHRMRAQYMREIDELLLDGWTAPAPQP